MKLYNTLAGEAQEFVPADGKTVKMYVCGVTPYSSTHVGHALSYVSFDVLRRYLEFLGFEVKHVQNRLGTGGPGRPPGHGAASPCHAFKTGISHIK